jgi:chromosome segregation ATPase
MNELEAKLNQIADNLLVQTSLVERFERRTQDRFAEHEGRMDRIELVLESLANGYVNLQAALSALVERVDTLSEGHRNLQVALSGLVEQIDRFIRGQQGDGRG